MPIIRIPTTPGAAPRAEDQGGFAFRRGQFDDQEKRRLRSTISEALENALRLGGTLARISADSKEKREEEEAERQVAEFRGQAEALFLSAGVAAKETAGDFAFDQGGMSQHTADLQTSLADNLAGLAERATNPKAKGAIENFISANLPSLLQGISIAGLGAVAAEEKARFEGQLIAGRDAARASGDLQPLLAAHSTFLTEGGEGAHFKLGAQEREKLKSEYFESSALTILAEALEDPARREQAFREFQAGTYDEILGEFKWRARSAAEAAGRSVLSFYEMEAGDMVFSSPADDPMKAGRDLLAKAEEDRDIAEAVYDPVEFQAWANQVGRLRREVARTEQADRISITLLIGDPALVPAEYHPLSEDGKLASTIGFRRLIESTHFQQQPEATGELERIAFQADDIARFLSAAGNTPESLGPWLQNLFTNFTQDDGTSSAMLAALEVAMFKRGVRVLDHGVYNAILNLDASPDLDAAAAVMGVGSVTSDGTLGAAEFAKVWRSLRPSQQELVQRQLNRDNLTGAAEAFNFGRDIAALDDLDSQIDLAAQDKTSSATKMVDGDFGANMLIDAAPETRGKMLTASMLKAAMVSRSERQRTERRKRVASLSRDLAATIAETPLPAELVDLLKAHREETMGSLTLLESGGEVFLTEFSPSVGEMVEALALEGRLGEDAARLAKRAGAPSLDPSDSGGWDPANEGEYDFNEIKLDAIEVWDDVRSRYPALRSQGYNYEAAIAAEIRTRLDDMGPSRFQKGNWVSRPPEHVRPDAWQAFTNEFTSGGKLAAWGPNKLGLEDRSSTVLENVTAVIETGEESEWKVIWTDPETGMPNDLRLDPDDPTSEVYKFRLKDEDYIRMIGLSPDGDPIKMRTRAIIEEARARIHSKAGLEKFRHLWGDLPPSRMQQFWEGEGGLAFPLIGAQSLVPHLSRYEDEPTQAIAMALPHPDAEDLQVSPPTDLLESLRSTESEFGFSSVNPASARRLHEYFTELPAAIERKRIRRAAAIAKKLDAGSISAERARYEINKIDSGALGLRRQVDGLMLELGPMVEWYDSAQAWGVDQDGIGADELYRRWRLMNLTGQWRAWRKMNGIDGARVRPADVPDAVMRWVETGGHEEWMDLPAEVRRRFE